MQTNQNVPRPFGILLQAVTYLIGGIFLLAVSSDLVGVTALIGRVFGGIFIGVAFFLAISSFFDKLVTWANRVDMQLFLAIFIVSIANLFVVAIESPGDRTFLTVLALAFSLIVIAAMLFWSFRTEARLRAELGSRAISARLLRRLSVVLSLVALGMVIAQVNVMGGPILYMALSLVCLSVASLL